MGNRKIDWSSLWRNEDWWACWFGFFLFFICLVGYISAVPRPQTWTVNPLNAIHFDEMLQIMILMLGLMVLYSIRIKFMRGTPRTFAPAFIVIFVIGFIAQIIARQKSINAYGFEYVFWALLIGILIRNSGGLPKWLEESLKTELYIKTGLVLLGAEVLFGVILKLGLYGLILAWGLPP